MKIFLLVMTIVMVGTLSHAETYTCSCTVQRNNGEEMNATSSNVVADSTESAVNASSKPCTEAAIAKFRFLTPFSEPELVSISCVPGSAGGFH